MASSSTESAAFLAESRVPQILIGSILPPAFSTIFVLARFYSRGVIMRNWGADDSWILVSWMSGGVVLAVLNGYLTKFGSGRHQDAIPFAHLDPLLRYAFVARQIYQFSLMTTKLGICAFYRRIFQDRTSKFIIWGMMAFVVCSSIPVMIAVFLQCQPREGAWSIAPSKCVSNLPSTWSSAMLSIVADVLLLAFVIPKIWNLQIARKQKIGLLGVIGLSSLAIVAAIVRLARSLSVFSGTDTPWNSYDLAIWSSVEVNTGLFCASAPAIKPLLRKIAPGLLSTLQESAYGNSRGKMGSSYGTGRHLSRRRQATEAFELSSQTDNKFSTNGRSTDEQLLDRQELKSNVSDDDSATGVLGLGAARGEIRKTVSVTVAETNTQSDASR